MTIELDHLIVPARDRNASAQLLARILDVPWSGTGVGPFSLREAGLPYRGTPHGPMDGCINTDHGGRIVYWSEPDGHVWEALTVSYARQPPGT